MGAGGTPGASLRAFRDLLPGASVFGADVDRDILFTEDRIRTGFLDQLDPASFDALYAEFGSEPFDLVIDDGLHSLGANLNTLAWALKVVKPGGWIVIEDISRQRLKPFDLVEHVLGSKDAVLDSFMVECGDGKRGPACDIVSVRLKSTMPRRASAGVLRPSPDVESRFKSARRRFRSSRVHDASTSSESPPPDAGRATGSTSTCSRWTTPGEGAAEGNVYVGCHVRAASRPSRAGAASST